MKREDSIDLPPLNQSSFYIRIQSIRDKTASPMHIVFKGYKKGRVDMGTGTSRVFRGHKKGQDGNAL